MSLQLRAELTEQAAIDLLSELLPATIDLDPSGADAGRRWIRVGEPEHVDFVPDRGLRIRTSASVQWTAVGVAVPASLREVQLMLRPDVVADERGPKLVFHPAIEYADFKLLPDFIDRAITNRINGALSAEADLIAWHFGESLTQCVPLPPNISPADALHLAADSARVSVHERGLVLEIELSMKFTHLRQEQPAQS